MSQNSIQATTSPSEIYERYIVPGIFARWSEVHLDLVAPQPGERVLGLACGTGIVARTAASMVQPGGEVIGVDFSPAQITMARSIDPSIEWREGDAGSLSFGDGELDLVVCQHGFQFFPDRVQAVREIHRVLKPGGRVGIAVWSSIDRLPGYAALIHALERRVGPSAAGLMTDISVLSDPGEVRQFLSDGGFPDAEVRTISLDVVFASADEFTRAIAVGSIMRRTQTEFSEETLALLSADVTADMESSIRADGFAFPMEAHLLTARK